MPRGKTAKKLAVPKVVGNGDGVVVDAADVDAVVSSSTNGFQSDGEEKATPVIAAKVKGRGGRAKKEVLADEAIAKKLVATPAVGTTTGRGKKKLGAEEKETTPVVEEVVKKTASAKGRGKRGIAAVVVDAEPEEVKEKVQKDAGAPVSKSMARGKKEEAVAEENGDAKEEEAEVVETIKKIASSRAGGKGRKKESTPVPEILADNAADKQAETKKRGSKKTPNKTESNGGDSVALQDSSKKAKSKAVAEKPKKEKANTKSTKTQVKEPEVVEAEETAEEAAAPTRRGKRAVAAVEPQTYNETAEEDLEEIPKKKAKKDNTSKAKAAAGKKKKPTKTKAVETEEIQDVEEEEVVEEVVAKVEKATVEKNSRAGRKRAAAAAETVEGDDDEDLTEAGSKPAKTKKPATPLNATATKYNKADFQLAPLEGSGSTEERFNLKISSWNVAGLRSWLKKDGLKYLDYEEPDIFCMQEIKCTTDQLPEEAARLPGYHPYWLCMPGGYAGVAIYSKIMPIHVEYGVGDAAFDDVGRIITAEYEKFFLINVYVPNSGRKLVNLEARMRWEKCFQQFVQKLDDRKPVVICGDMNVSHLEIDLANPKSNTRNAGFTKEERDKMSELLALGYVDTFRHLYPDRVGAYSYWTYMANARARNVGWRLDYFIVSERIAKRVVENCMRTQCMGSDHCPITLFMKL